MHAVDGKGAAADGSLMVKGFADNRIQIANLQGDNQSGLPGSMLPLPLRVGLADASNSPVAGAPVTLHGVAGRAAFGDECGERRRGTGRGAGCGCRRRRGSRRSR